MPSPNLGITHIAASQAQKEVTANEAFDKLDNATQRELEKDCSAGGTIQLTAAEYTENMVLKLTGTPAAVFTLEVPDGDRVFVVWNASGQTATVDTATGDAGGGITVVNDKSILIAADGTDLREIAGQTSGSPISNVVEDTTPELGGNLDGQDFEVSRVVLKDAHEVEANPSSSAGTLTLDVENGNVFSVTLTENITTLNLSNPIASGNATSITVIWKQDATGGRTIAYPASVKWAGGTAHAMTAAANAVDVLTLATVDGGTTWYGFVAGQDLK